MKRTVTFGGRAGISRIGRSSRGERLQRQQIHQLAAEIGFELCGVANCRTVAEAPLYQQWVEQGFAGRMSYLTDHRAAIRSDPTRLLSSAQSIICVGKLYNGPEPHSDCFDDPTLGWISRYAWGEDYHDVMRSGLEQLAQRIGGDHEWRAFADTAPLLERSYARQAGLGWIGKNTCLINQGRGSWFFLGELLTSLEIEADSPPPERCGTCTRCIDACPTEAIVPMGDWWTVDARACISYFTIELRGEIPEEQRGAVGRHVFGCDICQDVCPWNRGAPVDRDEAFAPRAGLVAPPLDRLAALSLQEFEAMFKTTPVPRARYRGFLRNVCVAMGNSGEARFREPLARLAVSGDELVAGHARWALDKLNSRA